MAAKPKRPQDREREDAMISMFKLIPTGERSGADATDEFGHVYELKSTTTNGIATARDTGPRHLKKWRKRNWICGKGEYEKNRFIFKEIYFLFPEQLEPWFSGIEAKMNADKCLTETVMRLVSKTKITQDKLERLNQIHERGSTMNAPSIPWTYIQKNGVLITEDFAVSLRMILKGYRPPHNVFRLFRLAK